VWPRRRALRDLLFSVPYGADAIQVALPGDGLSEARRRGVRVCLSTMTFPFSHELKVWYCHAGIAYLAAPVLAGAIAAGSLHILVSSDAASAARADPALAAAGRLWRTGDDPVQAQGHQTRRRGRVEH
jgi:3-hydroxyisobutyrate dehydrogenase-like beta-hydroxyacid dehydrogenase